MTKTLCTAAVGALLLAPSAGAVEALTTAELVSHCEKYHDDTASEDRAFCIRYIQGFIDGAVATDARVMSSMAGEYEKEETFSERAMRTRLGTRLERYGATSYAGYCLGDPVPLQEVVEHVVEDSSDPKLTAAHDLARELVYATLLTHYPCE
ncbi:MAG TPA: Rap1a/Tai family immunity protein [Steroidobacteraceae bacterium]|nr:Rap1a/Tai family immunity protein [Steroidobacteraceae bacterium]